MAAAMMRRLVRVLVGVGLVAGLLFFSDAASYAVDCTATPDDPACATPSPSPSPSPTPTDTATPAPGTDTGVYLDPSTGSLRVDENTGVALGISLWIAAVVAGLFTAYLVLP